VRADRQADAVVMLEMNKQEARDWISKTCGEGWLSLVDEVFNVLPDDTEVKAIYQKWGALNFDVSNWNEQVQSLHDHIENQSLKTCEVCGKFGVLVEIEDWSHTRCTIHAREK